jgi:hypothetical protein
LEERSIQSFYTNQGFEPYILLGFVSLKDPGGIKPHFHKLTRSIGIVENASKQLPKIYLAPLGGQIDLS